MLLAVVGTLFLCFFLFTLQAGSDAANLSKDFPWQFRLAARLRTPVLVFIVIPLSFLRWIYLSIRDAIRRRLRGRQDSLVTHPDRVKVVVDQLKEWNSGGRGKPLRTARPNWAGMSTRLGSNKQNNFLVQTAHLSHILEVNENEMTVTAEPNVTMGELTARLVPMGYALLVQVEMESITLGGVSMGFGMETNSHVQGFFQETILEFELVTADAEVITVSRDKDPELFFALPHSCGTVGFLTSVKVKLAKIKPYIHVTYIPVNSPEEMARKMTAMTTGSNPPEFLECTMYSLNQGVIQSGRMADKPESSKLAKINPINYFWKPFYFKWVWRFHALNGGSEYIPLLHYYHRFTRSIFWEIEDMIPFSSHWLFRCLWGWLGPPEVSLLKLFQGPVIREASVNAHVVQESVMPIRLLAEGVRKFDNWFSVYPLLIFPLRVYDRGDLSGFLHPRKENLVEGKDWGIWCDVGAYGAPREVREGGHFNAKKTVREMESWTRDIGGFQAYYTDIFATRKEFRQMWDHSLLDKARKRLNALDAFPEVYDKIKPERGLIDLTEEEEKERQQQQQQQ